MNCECGGRIVTDYRESERYCNKCGNVIEDCLIESKIAIVHPFSDIGKDKINAVFYSYNKTLTGRKRYTIYYGYINSVEAKYNITITKIDREKIFSLLKKQRDCNGKVLMKYIVYNSIYDVIKEKLNNIPLKDFIENMSSYSSICKKGGLHVHLLTKKTEEDVPYFVKEINTELSKFDFNQEEKDKFVLIYQRYYTTFVSSKISHIPTIVSKYHGVSRGKEMKDCKIVNLLKKIISKENGIIKNTI